MNSEFTLVIRVSILSSDSYKVVSSASRNDSNLVHSGRSLI
jgi:hypothetical protein